uniref:Uncharacterized protein n=1 Tax=Arundo donax TaxID=35708 RepID=A0A0A9CLX4_ARUDO
MKRICKTWIWLYDHVSEIVDFHKLPIASAISNHARNCDHILFRRDEHRVFRRDSYPPLDNVLCYDADDGAADRIGRVVAERVVLVLIPQIEHPLGVDSTIIDGA